MSRRRGCKFDFSSLDDIEDELNGLSLKGRLICPELLTKILSYVPDRNLIYAGRLVCKKWRVLIGEPSLWKAKALRRRCRLPHVGPNVGPAWPRHTYRKIARFDPFGRNLIKNPSGAQGNFNGWYSGQWSGWHQVYTRCSDGWKVENPPVGVESLDMVDELQDRCTSCFATTYQPGKKWQMVDLAAEGCSGEMMAALQPDIYICEWFAAGFDSCSIYQLKVMLQDANHTVVDQFEFERVEPLWADSRWTKVEHTFRSPPLSVCFVLFYHSGESQYWAAEHGCKMTNATVRLILPQSDPGPVQPGVRLFGNDSICGVKISNTGQSAMRRYPRIRGEDPTINLPLPDPGPVLPDVHFFGDDSIRDVRISNAGRSATWCYPGIRIKDLTTRIKILLNVHLNPIVVVMCTGTSNVPTDIAEQLRDLIRDLRQTRSNVRIIVSGVLPRFDLDRHRNEGRNLNAEVSQKVSDVCQGEGVTYADAAPELLRYPWIYYMRDGLNLTAEGKAVVGSVLQKAVARYNQGN